MCMEREPESEDWRETEWGRDQEGGDKWDVKKLYGYTINDHIFTVSQNTVHNRYNDLLLILPYNHKLCSDVYNVDMYVVNFIKCPLALKEGCTSLSISKDTLLMLDSLLCSIVSEALLVVTTKSKWTRESLTSLYWNT